MSITVGTPSSILAMMALARGARTSLEVAQHLPCRQRVAVEALNELRRCGLAECRVGPNGGWITVLTDSGRRRLRELTGTHKDPSAQAPKCPRADCGAPR